MTQKTFCTPNCSVCVLSDLSAPGRMRACDVAALAFLGQTDAVCLLKRLPAVDWNMRIHLSGMCSDGSRRCL
jgi:hypothetical protein